MALSQRHDAVPRSNSTVASDAFDFAPAQYAIRRTKCKGGCAKCCNPMFTGSKLAVAWVVVKLCPGSVSQGSLVAETSADLPDFCPSKIGPCPPLEKGALQPRTRRIADCSPSTPHDCFVAVNSVAVFRCIRSSSEVLDPRLFDFPMT